MVNSIYPQSQLEHFGPPRPRTFDFTLLFEDRIFMITPASLFLIAAFIRTVFLYGSPVKVFLSESRQIKTALLSAFVALNLTLLMLFAITPKAATIASVPAESLEFAAALALFILSFYEHTRSVTPSTIIAIYLVVTLPLDIARVRTLFLLGNSYPTTSIAAVSTLAIIVKLGIVFCEAASKRHILLDRYHHLPFESTSGPYSRLLVWWVNPLLWRGFNNFFEVDDLDRLEDSLSSTIVGAKFQEQWRLNSKTHKYSLLTTVCSVLKWSIIASGIPRFFLIGLSFAQPFLIQRTIEYVSDRSDQPRDVGWVLVGAYALVYVGLALLTASSTYLINRVTIRMRAGLVTLIYQKTVELSINSLEEGAAMTLMSADVERITKAFSNLNNTWAAIIQVAVSLYILYTTLSVGFIAPGICFLSALLVVLLCTKLFPQYQTIWVEAIQSRVSSTASMLVSMRSIKLLGISEVVGNLTQQLRARENILARKLRRLLLFQVLFQNITSILAPVVTFAVYVIQANATGSKLDTATAFSILSVLQLVELPLMLLMQSLPALVGSLGCLTRIQRFLLAPSLQDHRLSLLGGGQYDSTDSDEAGTVSGDIGYSPSRAMDDVFVLRQCSFGWIDDKPLVHDIDMRIRHGLLSMIVGPTGCGKSTLIKGILGETPFSTGFTYIGTDSIAFADQDPWIINSTIKYGICGEYSIDEIFYQEVIDCCGLREDLNILPKGDETVVGSKGISLSGGQKLRLALARAIFSQKNTLILDDVFSGLDADTEEHIFRSLFSRSGLLRRNDTTIILVTHAVARLSYADWVIVLNKDGAIQEQGTYEKLKQNGEYVSSLAVQFSQTVTEAVSKPVEVRKLTVNVAGANEDRAANLLARQTSEWVTYKHYFSAAGWKSLVSAFVWSFLYVSAIKAPGLVIKYFTGPDKTTSSNKSLMVLLGIAAVVSLISITLVVWQVFLDIVPRVSNCLHESLLKTVLGAPLSFFTKEDLATVDNEIPMVMVATILQIALLIIGGGLMATTATYFLTTIPVVIFALFVLQKFYLRTSRQLRHLELEAKAPLYTHFQETLSGLPSIRAFGWVDQFCSKNLDLLDRSQRPFYLLLCIQCWLVIVLDLMVAALATILMIIIVSLRHKIDPGLVGLGLLNIVSFNSNLSELIQVWTLTETSMGAIARIRAFVNNSESETKSMESFEPPLQWPSSGAIEIRNFAASYSKSSDCVVKDINITVRPGEKLGICGRSGSGKSSLLASLFHLLEFQEGSITVDGRNIAFMPRNLLRKSFNAIPQDPYWITTETVRFNLQPWAEGFTNNAELIGVLKKCQIWDAIQEKGGLDGENGCRFFSHGQRQLFCLARSLLRKSKIIVLDEVSASVDIHTDAIIQAVIREEFCDCTIISIAHRLKTIVDFDRIIVLHEGRVVECDTPQVLLSRPDSWFRELYEL